MKSFGPELTKPRKFRFQVRSPAQNLRMGIELENGRCKKGNCWPVDGQFQAGWRPVFGELTGRLTGSLKYI